MSGNLDRLAAFGPVGHVSGKTEDQPVASRKIRASPIVPAIPAEAKTIRSLSLPEKTGQNFSQISLTFRAALVTDVEPELCYNQI